MEKAIEDQKNFKSECDAPIRLPARTRARANEAR